MNIKGRIKKLEDTSKAGVCNCPNIIVIRPGEAVQKPCLKCFDKREKTLVLPSLDIALEHAEIVSSAGKIYGGFNPDLI
jgi:hypothetical protein